MSARAASGVEELSRRLGPRALPREPMARHTSLGVGGPADVFLVARSSGELVRAVDTAEELGGPWRILGSGSNLVVSDDGIEGLVVRAASRGLDRPRTAQAGPVEAPRPSTEPALSLSKGSGRADVLVRAEAGWIFSSLARRLAAEGLGGLEWAVNVPGTVGAAVVNNSGAFGSSTAEHLAEADIHVPGRGARGYSARELEMSYRSTILKSGGLRGLVLAATFRLQRADPIGLQAHIRDIQARRRATQPGGASVGSVFGNPPGDASGRLLEAAGLKGHRIGGSEVSRLHANFILNRGGATAHDVLRLMQHAQRAVWEKTGAWLVPEVDLVGRWDPSEREALRIPPWQGA